MIRLARTGKTKKPYFRLIVSEKTKDTHGDYLEILGHINPHAAPREIVLKADRIKYWLGVGAQPSPAVHNVLVDKGILSGEKLRVWKPKKKETTEAEAKPAQTKAATAPVEEAKKEEAAKPAEPKAEA